MHWGGGTPTYLDDFHIGEIVEAIDKGFGLAAGGEVALESDPRTLTKERAKVLAAMGFTRISFGVQDFATPVQMKINRLQTFGLVKAATEFLREAGFTSVNFDLMYGLPAQTVESVAKTAQQAAELKKLRFSSRFHSHFGYGTFTYAVPRHRLAELRKAQEPGQRMVITHADAKVPLLFAKGEPLPETIVEQIYATSVEDAEKAMQTMIHPEFESREERLHNFLYDEGLAITVGNAEENERAFALMFRIQAAERGMLRPMYREVLQTTFSQNFRSTPPKSLLGTGPINQLCGGHVIASQDLIKQLIMAALEHADRLLARRDDEFKLLGRVITSDDIAQKQDMKPLRSRIVKLEKPYTAIFRGLPIRVTESIEVGHADDSEGLAADYYLDHQNQALHFVALYRVPVPAR